ncbi:hypothetical protein ACS0TY_018999 [Phlomoides rotata]
MANKSNKRTPRYFTLRDEPILQPRIHSHSVHKQFDMSNSWDTTMVARTQEERRLHPGYADKETPIVVSRSKRIHNGCTSKQPAPNMLSHHPFMDMPLVEQPRMSSHAYDILGEEARIEEELMNGSYELNSQIMARLWEESRVGDGMMNGSYEEKREKGDEVANKTIKKSSRPHIQEECLGLSF